MDKLIEQAEKLKKDIESNQKEIENPVLYHSTISALEFFIENVGRNE